MPALATPRVKSFIGALLAGDATLTALLTPGKTHWDQAPQGAPFPYILISALSPAIPSKYLGNTTAVETSVIQVIGVTRASNNVGLLPIMDRVNDLLEGASGTGTGTASNAVIFVISGEGEIDYPEPPDPGSQVPYPRLGRRWRVQSKVG